MAGDLLEWGSNWLEAQRTKHATRMVTYQRGPLSVDAPATVGRTRVAVDDGLGGVHTAWTDRDFLILAVDLVLGGAQVLPEPGDRIREPQNGAIYVYEVLAPGREKAWRYSDPYRQTLRIHTKLVGLE